jgi:3-oxoacyl-[acyl-carrier-protein] synthase III
MDSDVLCLSACVSAMHAGPPLPVPLPASCITLDVTNACVGMLNGLMTVASMIEAGVVDYALVVDAETVEVSPVHCQCRHHCLIESYSCPIGSYSCLDTCQLPSKALPPGATVMRLALPPGATVVLLASQ